jgi:hypothetical protein
LSCAGIKNGTAATLLFDFSTWQDRLSKYEGGSKGQPGPGDAMVLELFRRGEHFPSSTIEKQVLSSVACDDRWPEAAAVFLPSPGNAQQEVGRGEGCRPSRGRKAWVAQPAEINFFFKYLKYLGNAESKQESCLKFQF